MKSPTEIDIIEDGMTPEAFIEHVNSKHGFTLGVQPDLNPSRGYHQWLHENEPQDHSHAFTIRTATGRAE